ncbi:DNA primase [Rhodobacter sp. KR11]|uniref:DNA primase n=1 Tax=Rhodobacter sp. KR11 TaxID=2974588 RepID=UPI0022239AB8|nr:DNA primase [Rhodobacter sp. KR11]MCW1920634.1 DNA primase [Rhodobacter sp. KR11]
MSLPPGFLDELRTRVTLSAVVGRKVTWDMRKSNQGRGDFWAPCPFHQEKSASFHVDDRKGFYYCFGCQAKGDALTFVKESENLSFMEAVETLAREAGMQMPARDPVQAQKADRRTQLSEVMEEAVKWFRLQLKTSAAAEARAYLAKRGLSPEAQDRWHIGFAPDAWEALHGALTAKGIASDMVIEAGLAIRPDEGKARKTPYDRFRNRIIFPIRDGRGRAISLGGRAMDPNDRAKYLNGPETALFDKGRNLFNLGPAREAVGKGKPLVVSEGYMDVIALSEAGFTGAVAPLGTAITEEQLRLMWRISDEPVIALDGDKAGIRAALRLIDLALPLLEAGKGLRFAIMPGGQDPDELIKAQGAPAMQSVLDQAQPMVSLLWNREIEGKSFDSPERKAALDKTLRGLMNRIADPSIRAHYTEEIRRLRAALFGPKARPFQPQGPRGTPWKRQAPDPVPLAATRASLLAGATDRDTEELREAVILAALATHPRLVDRFESDLERMDMSNPAHEIIRDALLLRHDPRSPALDAVLARPHVLIAPPVRNREDTELATLCLAEEFAKLAARRGARREIEEAMEDMDRLPDEGLTWRLTQAAQARHRAENPHRNDTADLGEDRTAMSNHLQSLIDGKIWEKKR